MSAVTRIGSGSELYVFLHGTPSDSSIWREVVSRQPGSATSLLFDLPDHGAAPDLKDPAPETLELELCRALSDVGPRFTLVGHSYGAYLAARLATRLSTRVTRLVLLSGFAAIPGAMAEAFQSLAAALRAGDATLATVTAVALERWYGAAPTDAERSIVADIVGRTGEARAERLLERIARLTGPAERVAPYGQPAMVLHARGDGAVPLELGQELHGLGEQAELEIVESGLHLLPLSHAPLIARRVYALD